LSNQPRITDYGISPEKFGLDLWEESKRYLNFGHEDQKRLQATLPRYEEKIKALVDQFYDHLLAFEKTRAVLEREDVAGHLKPAQQQYLRTLAGGNYGEGYLKDRLRIGLVHERIGLSPRWYLGAYWIYIRDLLPLIVPAVSEEDRSRMLSFLKIILLDMMLVTESYVGRTLGLVREQNERLEEIIAQRTQQLSKWERLAAVGSMAAKVAHEIRNPLSSISLNTELLSDELASYKNCDTREAGELLQAILGELDRLGRLVDEYMIFAHLPLLNLAKVNLRELIEAVVKFSIPELERSGIEIEVVGGKPSPELFLDRDQLRHALLNLLRNSQEAMPDGGKITIQIVEDPDGSVETVVIDTGSGIDAENLDRVFDPFYTTKDMGTGLGLAFVQQVVTEHGGRVSCTSQPGRGAAFRLIFPERLRARAPGSPA
jgi:signal transduction histidine kinase